MLSGGVPCTGQAESPDPVANADSSESKVEEVPDPQTPKPKGKTDKERQKEQEKAERKLRKQEEARERQLKKKEKEKEKKAKEYERANHKKRINWQRQLLRHPHRTKKGHSRASRIPCNVVSGLAYARATATATTSNWRPHLPPDHDCRWTIPDIQPRTQTL